MTQCTPRGEAVGRFGFLSRFHADCSGATATEYIMILALVVLPIALMTPLFLNMLKVYGTRVLSLIGLPFP